MGLPQLLALLLLPLASPVQDRGRPWGPEQAAGPPDCPAPGDDPRAWASRTRDGRAEWLRLHYPEPVVPRGVRVVASHAPGALRAVVGIDADGMRHELWRGLDPAPTSAPAAVTLVPLAGTLPLATLELELDSPAVPDWNEIDAVGLHDAEGRLWWASAAEAGTTYARGPAPDLAPLLTRPVALEDLSPGLRTPADGVFALFVQALAAGPGASALAPGLAAEVLALQRPAAPAPAGFEGRWETRHGVLELAVGPDGVTGRYPGGTLVGRIADGRLQYAYREDSGAEGEGWFELAGADELRGAWRARDGEREHPWNGRRAAPPRPGHRWLIVLEAPWEERIDERPYSFGAMLEAVFGHLPHVDVRVRDFTDEGSFRTWCASLEHLAEPVDLFVSTHATRDGLQCAEGTIPPAAVAEALGSIPTLRLVHFSACEVLAGDLPALVLAACANGEHFRGLSGYDISVDWMGSALTEFLYLDLLLGRGLEPAQAAAHLVELLDFADDTVPAHSPIPASHFRFLPAPGR